MKNFHPSSVSFWILVVLAIACCCHGRKNRDAPHIHRGVLSSYEAGPFSSIDLDKSDEKVLNAGKPIMKQTQGEGEELGGSSICVQDVAAPKVRCVALRRKIVSELDRVGSDRTRGQSESSLKQVGHDIISVRIRLLP
jgi:hypothetical protein